MRRATKLMMMDNARQWDEMRDRREREREYSPDRGDRRRIGFQSGGDYGDPEMRRRRDSRGRYMYGDDEPRMWYDDRWRGYDGGYDMRGPQMHHYQDREIRGSGAFVIQPPQTHPGMMGGMMHAQPLDEESAMRWTRRMKNTDGTTGPHYSPDQAEQYRTQFCPECKRWDFYAAFNMMYSDYCSAAQKLGVNTPDFYAHMAKSFLCDEDAGQNKMAKYIQAMSM